MEVKTTDVLFTLILIVSSTGTSLLGFQVYTKYLEQKTRSKYLTLFMGLLSQALTPKNLASMDMSRYTTSNTAQGIPIPPPISTAEVNKPEIPNVSELTAMLNSTFVNSINIPPTTNNTDNMESISVSLASPTSPLDSAREFDDIEAVS